MGKMLLAKKSWIKRKIRVRKKIYGTQERPRLTVFRSLNNMYAQVVNDNIGKTIIFVSTLGRKEPFETGHKGNIVAAKKLGIILANSCLTQGISKVVFDRNGYLYHGRVKALAESARNAGLDF